MVNDSNTLKPVAKLAKQKEKCAARTHGNVLKELREQEKQLDELIDYRKQYLTAFDNAGKTGLTAIQLQDYRIFLQRLDAAIKQQQQIVIEKKNNTESSKSNWLDNKNKSKMINKVIDNRKKIETDKKEQSEQRELEDRSISSRQIS